MSSHAIDAVNLPIMWDRLVGITDEPGSQRPTRRHQ